MISDRTMQRYDSELPFTADLLGMIFGDGLGLITTTTTVIPQTSTLTQSISETG